MSYSLSKIDPTLTEEKLRKHVEGQYFDRKSARLNQKELARHISAFANANGGVVALGIEDNGDVTGIELVPNSENEFRQAASVYLHYPPDYEIELIEYAISDLEKRTIMIFHVQPSINSVIKTKAGEIFLRIGDQSKKLIPDEVIRLEYARGVRSFEEQIAEDATWDDLDPDALKLYAEQMHSEVSTVFELLKARGVIKVKNGVVQITNAGVLLFGKYPTQFLPNARVRFLRYDGTIEGVGQSMNIIKDVVVEKALPLLLIEMKALLSSQMREFQTLDEDGRFRKYPEYPEFAWLEGLVNAVTHRDYSIRGEHIRIKMFDDRIEFLSPGKLPNIVTVENIRTTRYSRNPIIARILTDLGWVRELNEGVKRIYIDMENLFLDPPSYSEPRENVLLILRNNIAMRSMRRIEEIKNIISQEKWNVLDPLERKIILHVANIERCTMKDLIEATGKSRVTVAKRLANLMPTIVKEHKTSPNDPTKFYTL